MMKNKRKKFAFLVIIAAVIMSFAACGQPIRDSRQNAIDLSGYSQEDQSSVQTVMQSPESSGTCGEHLSWYYKDGILVIDGSGDMQNFSDGIVGEKEGWFKDKNVFLNIQKVIMKEGCTSIGEYAFTNCSSLTSISIPNSVTKIGNYAFMFCRSLTSVKFH